MRRFVLLATIAAGLCAVPAAASASTAAVTGNETITISAGAGEANHIQITDSGSREQITDTVGITAGGGCEQLEATKVLCEMPGTYLHLLTIVDLGDGNDYYQDAFTGARDDIDAGTGDDEIYSDLEDDIVRGGPGNDKISGGSGTDQLDGAAGDDNVAGNSGNDTVFGGAGRDLLEGDGPSTDDGSDTIRAEDGEKDTVSCDNGTDKVTADDIDVVDVLCEDVERKSVGGDPPDTTAPSMSIAVASAYKLRSFLRRGLPFSVTFRERVSFAAALFVPKKTARKFRLGRKDLVIATGSGSADAGTFKVKLTDLKNKRKLRALLRRDGFRSLPVVFQALATDEAGNEATAIKHLKLKR